MTSTDSIKTVRIEVAKESGIYSAEYQCSERTAQAVWDDFLDDAKKVITIEGVPITKGKIGKIAIAKTAVSKVSVY